MLMMKLKQVRVEHGQNPNTWTSSKKKNVASYLLHRLRKLTKSSSNGELILSSWKPSKFDIGVQINVDHDDLGYDNTARL
jgi:hypothetical protein